jgi:hypothetical protein
MIAMGMMVVVLMYQHECQMDWISDGGYDEEQVEITVILV